MGEKSSNFLAKLFNYHYPVGSTARFRVNNRIMPAQIQSPAIVGSRDIKLQLKGVKRRTSIWQLVLPTLKPSRMTFTQLLAAALDNCGGRVNLIFTLNQWSEGRAVRHETIRRWEDGLLPTKTCHIVGLFAAAGYPVSKRDRISKAISLASAGLPDTSLWSQRGHIPTIKSVRKLSLLSGVETVDLCGVNLDLLEGF